MTVLLDTDLIPERERERAEAVHTAYESQSPRRSIIVDPLHVHHRVERVVLGTGAHLLRASGSPLQIVRTVRQVRADAPEHVAIGLRRHGEGHVSAGVTETDLPVGHLNCVDMTRPYQLVHRTTHAHDVLILSNDAAGVTVDVVRAALPALSRSPVYPLVRGHLANLFDSTIGLAPELQVLTGQATTALMRALLVTAAPSQDGREALHDSLGARIAAYIDAHLTERDLSVERVAEAHHISLRHLYHVWEGAGHSRTPAQWIIARRLERAREQLALSDPTRTSIATIARRCGFSDPSHFTRRFRASFGSSPSEWRSTQRPAATPAAGRGGSA